MGVLAVLDGGRGHGMTVEVPDSPFVYVTVVDGCPVAAGRAADDVRGKCEWECYTRDAGSQPVDGRVRFFCSRPLDDGRHGTGTPPAPPARAGSLSSEDDEEMAP